MWVVGLRWLVFKEEEEEGEEESLKWELVYELVAQGGASQSFGKSDSQRGMRGGWERLETFAGGWATFDRNGWWIFVILIVQFLYPPLKSAASN